MMCNSATPCWWWTGVDDSCHVQNQDWAAIAEFSGARNTLDANQGILDAADDNFPLSGYPVDRDSYCSGVAACNEYVKGVRRICRSSGKPPQMNNWKNAVAVGNDLVVFQHRHRVRLDAEDFMNRGPGHCKRLIIDVNDESLHDREGQWQPNCETRAFAWPRFHGEGTAETMDCCFDDRHPNTTSGARSASSRVDKPGAQIISKQAGSLAGGFVDQSQCTRPVRYLFEIHATSVVLQFNDHGFRFGRCANPQMPFRGFARSHAFFGGLQSVADGVADHVEQRIHHPVDQDLVDLRAVPC